MCKDNKRLDFPHYFTNNNSAIHSRLKCVTNVNEGQIEGFFFARKSTKEDQRNLQHQNRDNATPLNIEFLTIGWRVGLGY